MTFLYDHLIIQTQRCLTYPRSDVRSLHTHLGDCRNYHRTLSSEHLILAPHLLWWSFWNWCVFLNENMESTLRNDHNKKQQIKEGSANFFCKGPHSTSFQFFDPYGLLQIVMPFENFLESFCLDYLIAQRARGRRWIYYIFAGTRPFYIFRESKAMLEKQVEFVYNNVCYC